MNSDDFDLERAMQAIIALEIVLQRRTHKVKYLGQEYLMPGTLGEALKLQKIMVQLQSPMLFKQKQGLELFQAIWNTLSATTCCAVLQEIGWYDPKALEWDDYRSNRQPSLKNDK